jgi:hypothetical protein
MPSIKELAVIYLASYKSTQSGWHGWINRGIRWVTRSIYSHSEICVGNPHEGAVWCVSSSGSEGGVRGKVMKLSAERWDVLPMPWVTPKDLDDFYQANKGSGYDYLGTARFLLPWLFGPSANRWFCTEVVAAIAGFKEPWRFSPADFHIVVQAQEGLVK